MDAVVETSYGKIRGVREADLWVFRGVPFARPPVGDLRFRPPQPPEPWSGVRDATRFGPAAPQDANLLGPIMNLGIDRTSEDCLYLNLWTPEIDATRRPVLAWIHGGAFVLGAGSQAIYDGAALARRGNVVVVTLNYRLGCLGFARLKTLSTNRMPAGGNEGLADQIAALEWVGAEIARFGGDPSSVTIFGESAGAMSCAALMAAPRAKGLFQRAILQSGAANYVSSSESATAVANEFLRELGVTASDAEALRETPAGRMVEAQGRLFWTLRSRVGRVRRAVPRGLVWLARMIVGLVRRAFGRRSSGASHRKGKLQRLGWLLRMLVGGLKMLFVIPRQYPRGLPFQPVIDGEVLPRHPFDAIEAGFAKGISLLVGTNLDEAKLFAFMDPEARRLTEPALIARCEHNIPGADATGVSHGQRAVDVYRRARMGRGERTTPRELWFAIESDRTMRYPAMRLAELQCQHEPQTYAYLFTWRSPFWGGTLGACHALELPFVFGTLRHPLLAGFAGSGPTATALAERMQDAWIAFARTGNPTHAGIGEWPPYEPARRATMIFDRTCRVEEAPREEERSFWEFWDGKF
jgi:para-nitrobenzyl esterase